MPISSFVCSHACVCVCVCVCVCLCARGCVFVRMRVYVYILCLYMVMVVDKCPCNHKYMCSHAYAVHFLSFFFTDGQMDENIHLTCMVLHLSWKV